ncbi:unnamed protein product [Psylliodes chrysocephalus]|uniref:Uncharacterized protein n=1 Tax=Psylliodes chrysocephalus TaxID=3402493 RepID=A0A9P0CJB5_9CUCU|nr:unnamed protein product [Psylliodes chrysocephala]
MFISGGAAVGKSHLIKTIELAVPHYLDKLSKAACFHKKSSSSTAAASSLLGGQQQQPPTIVPSHDNVGKYIQLPPVGDGFIFNKPNFRVTHANIVGKEGWLWQLFKYFELVEVIRQKDDVPFAKALNNLAEYRMSAEDISLSRDFTAIQQATSSTVVAPPQQNSSSSIIPRDAIRLFRTNASVQSQRCRMGHVPGRCRRFRSR